MTTKGEPLPQVDLPYRTKINAEPESVEAAKAERHQLAEMVQQLNERLLDPGAWRLAESRQTKKRIVEARLSFLKDWIKRQNVAAQVAFVTAACGSGGLDSPYGLIAALRNIILRERKAGRLEWAQDDRLVLDAATGYLQLLAEPTDA